MNPLFELVEGDGPIVATAIHDGHELRPECAERVVLDEPGRLREEDPHTGRVASVAPTHLLVKRSRFEVDLNRPRDTCVYRTPEEAWGLRVWNATLPDDIAGRSYAEYDGFYRELEHVLRRKVQQHGRVVVLDVHSYNHCRDHVIAPAEANPEINLGTESVDPRWRALVDRFAADLRAHGLDVRENVKFKGGAMARWINRTFAGTGCAIAIELKKTWMDEWTGVVEEDKLTKLVDAMRATLPGLAESLR